jgi:hypothetical protein
MSCVCSASEASRFILHTGPIPESIGRLQSLTLLFLNGNQLSGPIPESIGQLQSLAKLYLNTNQLEGEIPWEMLRALVQEHSLRQLLLGDNKFTVDTIKNFWKNFDDLEKLRSACTEAGDLGSL